MEIREPIWMVSWELLTLKWLLFRPTGFLKQLHIVLKSLHPVFELSVIVNSIKFALFYLYPYPL